MSQQHNPSASNQSDRAQWQLYPITEFPGFARDWDALADSLQAPPFCSARFIGHVIDNFSGANDWLAIKGDPADAEAMALLRRLSATSWQTFQPSQLSVGAWLMKPGLGFEAASEGLFQALPGLPLVIAILQQDPGLFERPTDSATIEAIDYKEIGWIPIEQSFEEFWNSRSRKFRQNYRTRRGKVTKQGTEISVEQVTDPSGVAEIVSEYGVLESTGWKGRAGTAVSDDNEQGRFYRAVFEDYCAAGLARLFRLRFDRQTVAIDLCIEHRDAQALLKTAYDESFKNVAPSTLLKYEVFQHAFDDPRLQRIEFFGRYVDWHTRWTEHTRTMYHVNLFRHPAVRWLRDLKHRMKPEKEG